ncbi:hypothetical protein [Rufibacter latericius]|uniref:Uncharacterized protein n=1 Tax=Rufibacter latericius TaxID=2487040 RepID=A0A3M9MM42_9BACT|nr:hypothetical protein [Rufibacter latericius]RNI26596.1 hypothetical protein EFB08_11295 [Rufibacter latericius]
MNKKEKNIGIEKAKINKDGFLECTYYQVENEVYSHHSVVIHRYVHQDLLDKFQKLNTHLCLITEQVQVGTVQSMLRKEFQEKFKITVSSHDMPEREFDLLGASPLDESFETGEIYPLECFSNFRCTGFINKEGMMLVGQRVLRSGKVVNLISPLTSSDEEYEFYWQLMKDFQETMDEVELHLNGKSGGGEQLDLFEDVA